jgi:hypothetical protein
MPEQQKLSPKQEAPATVQQLPSERQMFWLGSQQVALSPAVLLQHTSPARQHNATVPLDPVKMQARLDWQHVPLEQLPEQQSAFCAHDTPAEPQQVPLTQLPEQQSWF